MDFFRDSAKLPAAECLKPLVGEPHHETRRHPTAQAQKAKEMAWRLLLSLLL